MLLFVSLFCVSIQKDADKLLAWPTPLISDQSLEYFFLKSLYSSQELFINPLYTHILFLTFYLYMHIKPKNKRWHWWLIYLTSFIHSYKFIYKLQNHFQIMNIINFIIVFILDSECQTIWKRWTFCMSLPFCFCCLKTKIKWGAIKWLSSWSCRHISDCRYSLGILDTMTFLSV